jgi:hypothetical protein
MQPESHFTQGCPILMRPVQSANLLADEQAKRKCSGRGKKESLVQSTLSSTLLEAGRRRGGNGVDASSTRGGEREPPLS